MDIEENTFKGYNVCHLFTCKWFVMVWYKETTKCCAAKLWTSTGMHNDQKYGKSIMTSHKISDRDNGAKMLII